MAALSFLVLPLLSGASTGALVFVIAYLLMLLSKYVQRRAIHWLVPVISVAVAGYLTLGKEELQRSGVLMGLYIVGMTLTFVVLLALVWNKTNGQDSTKDKGRSKLVTGICILLGIQLLMLLIAVAPHLFNGGNISGFVLYLGIALVVGYTIFLLWKNRKMGLYLFAILSLMSIVPLVWMRISGVDTNISLASMLQGFLWPAVICALLHSRIRGME